jgi:hypothetical protein
VWLRRSQAFDWFLVDVQQQVALNFLGELPIAPLPEQGTDSYEPRAPYP